MAPLPLDEEFIATVRRNLGAHLVIEAPAGTQARAAVALVIAEEGTGAALDGMPAPAGWSREVAILLTRRSRALRNHAGQWALPGGRMDPGESPEEAALRELVEEIGLRLDASAVLGRLDDYVTRSGFAITPVIMFGGAARELTPNLAEVATIHRIPLTEFMRSDAPVLEASTDSEHPILRMPVAKSWIAAPTAAFLYQFREVCVLGRDTRVAHFDQPMFARR